MKINIYVSAKSWNHALTRDHGDRICHGRLHDDVWWNNIILKISTVQRLWHCVSMLNNIDIIWAFEYIYQIDIDCFETTCTLDDAFSFNRLMNK